MERDFEIIPLTQARGKEFGYNLTKRELDRVLKTDADWLKMIYKPSSGELPPSKGLIFYIKKKAPINEEMIQLFREKRIDYIPVLVEIDELKYRRKLSDFAKQHSLILTGKVYGCVRDWLRDSGKIIEKGIDKCLIQHMHEFNKTLTTPSKDLEYLVRHMIKEVLYVNENLSVLALYKELIDDINKYSYDGDLTDYQDDLKHSLAVATLFIILGKRAGLDNPRLKEGTFTALVHDIARALVFEKVRNGFAGRKINPYKFEEEVAKYSNLHSTYGALILTKRNGDSIQDIGHTIRHNILHHHQHIDGTGPSVYIPEQKRILEKIGINEHTKYFGFNKLPKTASEEDHYELIGDVDENAQKMTMIAQILSIIEQYTTRSTKTTKKKALAEMFPYIGKHYNGPVSEIFLNTMVPIEDFPDGPILKLKIKLGSKFEKLNNYSVITHTKDNKKNFYLIKNPNGELIQPKPIDILSNKDEIYLKLGDW